jgi:hypothetical protein
MICYDVFEKVCEYLSIQDMISFLMLNKQCYDLYKYNKRYNDMLFVKKFLQFLNLDTFEYKILETKNILKMYFYFKNHPSAHLSDILVYMIDNSLIDYIFFRFISSKCVFKTIPRVDDSVTQLNIDFTCQSFWDRCESNTYIYMSDIEYILKYGDDKHLDIILSFFDVSMVTLTRIFISRSSCGTQRCLKVLVKYMFIKHCFGMFCSVNQKLFLSCFVSLIKYKKTDVVRYILEKKRKYIKRGHLDYNYLVNRCVEVEDRKIFKLLLDEYEYDKNSGIQIELLVINIQHIIKHLRNGKINYIVYLVNHYLGNSIEVLVDSICESIDNLVITETDELHELNNLEKFLSRDNFEKIKLMYIRKQD